MNPQKKPVAVIVGATSKWQSNGRNTKLAHGRELDEVTFLSVCAGELEGLSPRNFPAKDIS
ncbi:MAG: hypothetical protein Ct9H300mP11_20290 [Chloroflexota bacterium]|nr:MAG: hypothetical protein Ct9H300mP11_20290 [Chloroflexota bacterium]